MMGFIARVWRNMCPKYICISSSEKKVTWGLKQVKRGRVFKCLDGKEGPVLRIPYWKNVEDFDLSWMWRPIRPQESSYWWGHPPRLWSWGVGRRITLTYRTQDVSLKGGGGTSLCRLSNISYRCLIDWRRVQAVVQEFGEGGGIGSVLF